MTPTRPFSSRESRERESGARTVSRRTALAGAAATVTLAGCARPSRLLASLGVRSPLEIEIVGVPAGQASPLVDALGACQGAYEEAHRGRVALHVTTSLIPEVTWYTCSTPAHCPPGAYPASLVHPSAADILMGGAKTAGQIGSAGVPRFLVRGRTRLDVQFGDGALLVPEVNGSAADLPDIVLGYDLWQYWLTPLATDLGETWKTLTGDRSGLPTDFERYARFYWRDRGTFVAAFPLLRNPMMLFNWFGEATPWTWPRLLAQLPKPPGAQARGAWLAVDLRQSPLYPQPTEWAAAMVVAAGARLAMTTAQRSSGAFDSAAAVAGLRSLAAVIAAFAGMPAPVTYMWNPLGGVRAPFGIEGFFPWPAGSVRTAVPCTYLCATVVAGRKHAQRAQDFASFLMSPASQRHLVRWPGGLALRTDQARPQAAGLFPRLPANLVETLISGENDLTAADLYGGEKTRQNAATYDGVADRFAGALGGLAAAGSSSAKLGAVLRQAANG